MFQPLAAQPVFDLWAGGKETSFKFKKRPGQGSGQMRNHKVLSLIPRVIVIGGKSYTAVHKKGATRRSRALESG